MLNADPSDSQKIIQDSFSNLGLNLVHRVFYKTQRVIRDTEEQKVKDATGKNYQDSLNALSFYKAAEAQKHEGFEEVSVNEEKNEIENYFWYIIEGRNERPIWVNNIDRREKPINTEALIQSLPTQFVKNLVPPRKGGDF